jgi:hypothetical protein
MNQETYYVSNENGDWWQIQLSRDLGNTLFVISESRLQDITGESNPDVLDKLERVIQEHGSQLTLEASDLEEVRV